jgi:hypothetical protein
MNSIKWKKLANILTGFCRKEVIINVTTSDRLANTRSLTEHRPNFITVFINGNKVKDISDVIDALAYELSHSIIQNVEKPDILWEELRRTIADRYVRPSPIKKHK